jgi:hypothetical protein
MKPLTQSMFLARISVLSAPANSNYPYTYRVYIRGQTGTDLRELQTSDALRVWCPLYSDAPWKIRQEVVS